MREPNLGRVQFIGSNNRTETFRVPGGLRARFQLVGRRVELRRPRSARTGTDGTSSDLTDPSEWEVAPVPARQVGAAHVVRIGVHTLYIEATDNMAHDDDRPDRGHDLPLKMTRNLLWVDDFYSTDFPRRTTDSRPKTEHDDFWLEICYRARGFNPDVDVYETAQP